MVFYSLKCSFAARIAAVGMRIMMLNSFKFRKYSGGKRTLELLHQCLQNHINCCFLTDVVPFDPAFYLLCLLKVMFIDKTCIGRTFPMEFYKVTEFLSMVFWESILQMVSGVQDFENNCVHNEEFSGIQSHWPQMAAGS